MRTIAQIRGQVTQDMASFTKVSNWSTEDKALLEELLVDTLTNADDLELEDTDQLFVGGLAEIDAVVSYIRLIGQEILLSTEILREGPLGGWDLDDVDRHTAHIVEATRLVNKLQKTYWDELVARI